MTIDPRDHTQPTRVGAPLQDAAAKPPEDLDGVPTLVGTPLRDAAVDPRPEDYLAPVNAGEPGPLGDPHGPHVVSPGLPDTRYVPPTDDA